MKKYLMAAPVAFYKFPGINEEYHKRLVGGTRTIYRVKRFLPDCINSLRVCYLEYQPERRPAWTWDEPNTTMRAYYGPCFNKGLIGTAFHSVKEWRNGLASIAVKDAKGAINKRTYGPCEITVVEEVYEIQRCECCGPPSQRVFVRLSEKVARMVHPKPTVLDKLAAI